jgi:hypothetical protein
MVPIRFAMEAMLACHGRTQDSCRCACFTLGYREHVEQGGLFPGVFADNQGAESPVPHRVVLLRVRVLARVKNTGEIHERHRIGIL